MDGSMHRRGAQEGWAEGMDGRGAWRAATALADPQWRGRLLHQQATYSANPFLWNAPATCVAARSLRMRADCHAG